MSWSRHVFSTMVSEIAYDSDAGEMIVTFVKGRRAAYEGVPEEVAEAGSREASVGTWLNNEIKPFYRFRYV